MGFIIASCFSPIMWYVSGVYQGQHADEVGGLQELFEGQIGGVELLLHVGVPVCRVVRDLHVKSAGPFRDRPADLSHPDDPEFLAIDLRTQHIHGMRSGKDA